MSASLTPSSGHYTHKQYHAALNRASWLQRPLVLPEKGQIKQAENAILAVDDPKVDGKVKDKVKEEQGKVIHDAQHKMFNRCSELIDRMQKDPVFGKTAEALAGVADRLGGIVQELSEADRPQPLPTGPITHDSKDHHDPGTIRLCRIFQWLKFRAWGFLKEINEGWKEHLEGNSERWTQAKVDFGEFMKKLDGFAPAIYTFKVRPIENAEGFIVSARMSAKYLNPEHSSATVHVP